MTKFLLLTTGILFFSCTADSIEEEVLINNTQNRALSEDIFDEKTSSLTTKDTDNDGINDDVDADVDGDGTIDNGSDNDGDGISDFADVDTNNDGIDDNGTDIDEDGINDTYDNDIDGDGIENEEDEYASLSDTELSPAVQDKITSYLNVNYADKTIIEVEIDNQSIEIDLNGNVELNFDLEGTFISHENDQEIEDDDYDSEDLEDENDENDNDDSDEHFSDTDQDNENDQDEFTSLSDSNLSETVQTKITNYILTNYPNASITEVEVEGQEIEIELSNNKELIFDLNGNFIRLDD